MKKCIIVLGLFLCAHGYAGSPEYMIESIVPGLWRIELSDLIMFQKKGVQLEHDPLYRAEIRINSDKSGLLTIDGREMPFTWSARLNRLMVSTAKRTYQFKVRPVDEGMVMIVQEKASRPDIAFVGILRRIVIVNAEE